MCGSPAPCTSGHRAPVPLESSHGSGFCLQWGNNLKPLQISRLPMFPCVFPQLGLRETVTIPAFDWLYSSFSQFSFLCLVVLRLSHMLVRLEAKCTSLWLRAQPPSC